MASITPTKQDLIFGSSVTTWSPMASGDTGVPVGIPGAGDRTVQVNGTFGVGGTAVIEGTLDMVNWYQLHDPAVVALSFTSAGLGAILENVLAVRPRIAGGDVTTALTVTLLTRKSMNG